MPQIISTSNCGNPALRVFGFGPVTPGGFGVGYIIKDNGISFCVTSKHRQTDRYILTIQRYLNQVQRLVTPPQSRGMLRQVRATTTFAHRIDFQFNH
eukprot:SAG11_NODE_119_length_15911_cov_7.077599_12_plen_97_part_00